MARRKGFIRWALVYKGMKFKVKRQWSRVFAEIITRSFTRMAGAEIGLDITPRAGISGPDGVVGYFD